MRVPGHEHEMDPHDVGISVSSDASGQAGQFQARLHVSQQRKQSSIHFTSRTLDSRHSLSTQCHDNTTRSSPHLRDHGDANDDFPAKYPCPETHSSSTDRASAPVQGISHTGPTSPFHKSSRHTARRLLCLRHHRHKLPRHHNNSMVSTRSSRSSRINPAYNMHVHPGCSSLEYAHRRADYEQCCRDSV